MTISAYYSIENCELTLELSTGTMIIPVSPDEGVFLFSAIVYENARERNRKQALEEEETIDITDEVDEEEPTKRLPR